jgi:hypothetical protein
MHAACIQLILTDPIDEIAIRGLLLAYLFAMIAMRGVPTHLLGVIAYVCQRHDALDVTN